MKPESVAREREAFLQALETKHRVFDSSLPDVFVGLDGFVFMRSSCLYLYQDTLHQSKTNEKTAAFSVVLNLHRQLEARGISLVFVPVPDRAEVYPDKLIEGVSPQVELSIGRREFVKALQAEGVHAIDLLPLYKQHRNGQDLLYCATNTHWATPAIEMAAAAVADAISPLLPRPASDEAWPFEAIEMAGRSDLVPNLAESERGQFAPERWRIHRVLLLGGRPYADSDVSPVVVAGDSFTIMFADKSGGISAHLAAKLRTPVTLLSVRGGGPAVPRMLARQGEAYLKHRRVVVWVLAARYLAHGNARDWQTATLP